jgi:hypothetical protein
MLPRTTFSCLKARSGLGRAITEEEALNISDKDLATIIAAAQAYGCRDESGLPFARVLLRVHEAGLVKCPAPGFELDSRGMQLMSPAEQTSLRGLHELASQTITWPSHTVPAALATSAPPPDPNMTESKTNGVVRYTIFDQALIFLRLPPAQKRDLAGQGGMRGSVEYYEEVFGGDVNLLESIEVRFMYEDSNVMQTMGLPECELERGWRLLFVFRMC